ncbi:MAG: hypothetical protein EOM34_10760 [Clostridia bacterium]|nr:hypothetical protein [Lachnospiraceae bacterium]NCC01138.1 hypothetical protein [Clostridia bacterium]NCD03037.1 hypothetical protein [Clostridia bacterium]
MNEIYKTGNDYIGYEYKELVVEKKQVSFYLDGFENFGWEIDNRQPEIVESNKHGKTVIRLKRDRKIMNKAELTRLQRNFEDCMKQMDSLENSKTSLATVVALIIGILGTAFIACSVFAVTHEPPLILLCIILAIPGFVGWIAPFFVYKRLALNKARALAPLIEKKQDEIYEICEKGHKLLV